ncbi:MAG: DUF4188 domain-containing protein [Alphaproteobacteria bacterium]|nr:DUF4188 domain-containing protein [Alphaproteobacteria bacterium]
MTNIIPARMAAKLDGDFVVFLIGMRVNKWWKVWKWAPVAASMPRMLIELGRRPELGLLHARTFFGFPNIFVLQYWRSFEHLHRYAVDKSLAHLPAWRAFNRAIASNGDVGIWHETYLVKDGAHESVYNNMPPWGLAVAGESVPAEGSRKSAKGRLRQTDGADQPIDA